MLVEAIRTGYDGLQRRKEGAQFDWDDAEWERLKAAKKLPSWVKPVGSKKAKKAGLTLHAKNSKAPAPAEVEAEADEEEADSSVMDETA